MNNKLDLYCGDCRKILKELPDKSVYCCVTSPPYWGLRDYKIEPLIWGGDENCKHEWNGFISIKKYDQKRDHKGRDFGETRGTELTRKSFSTELKQGQFCQLCNAWRGSLGLEPTPEMYTQHLVEIFREVKRVLRNDGTLWLNLGDTYSTQAGQGFIPGGGGQGNRWKRDLNKTWQPNRAKIPGLKPKDLVGIPWRVAFALQTDGWYLRSDIIWSKLNPMPESVRDRPTKSHEYIFLLSKSKKYYYDADAIKEPMEEYERCRRLREKQKGLATIFKIASNGKTGQNPQGGKGVVKNAKRRQELAEIGYRNKRSIWTISTQPFPGMHFSTYPLKLIEPCILAGCPGDGVILDPFIGSGTSAVVALNTNRKCIGIDLNPEYIEMTKRRIQNECKQ